MLYLLLCKPSFQSLADIFFRCICHLNISHMHIMMKWHPHLFHDICYSFITSLAPVIRHWRRVLGYYPWRKFLSPSSNIEELPISSHLKAETSWVSSNTIINLAIWHIYCVGHVNKVIVPGSSRAQWHLHFQQTLFCCRCPLSLAVTISTSFLWWALSLMGRDVIQMSN